VKPCSKCRQQFPLSEFYSWKVKTKTKGERIRYRYICKACDRTEKRKRDKRTTEERAAKHLMDKYGITPEEKENLLRLQDGKCGICPRTEPGGRYNVFHVDHCHITGKVRGLLCDRCNRALGLFKDDEQNCIRASQYLAQSRPLG
jgi:hypothetical protein